MASVTSGAKFPTNILKSFSGHSDKLGSTQRSPAADRTTPTLFPGGASGAAGFGAPGGGGGRAIDGPAGTLDSGSSYSDG